MREEAFETRLESEDIIYFFVSGNTEPNIIHPIVYLVPLVTAPDPSTHAFEEKKSKCDKNDYLINVSHGTSISVLALARSKTSDGANSKAHDTRERKSVLGAGASYHLVNNKSFVGTETASIRDAIYPLKHRTAHGIVSATKVVDVLVGDFKNLISTAYVLKNSHCLLSLGLLVQSNFRFVGGDFESPKLVSPNGLIVICWKTHTAPFVSPIVQDLCLFTEDDNAQCNHDINDCAIQHIQSQIQQVAPDKKPVQLSANSKSDSSYGNKHNSLTKQADKNKRCQPSGEILKAYTTSPTRSVETNKEE